MTKINKRQKDAAGEKAK